MTVVRRHLPERFRDAPIYVLSYIVFLWTFAFGVFVWVTRPAWWGLWVPPLSIAAVAFAIFAVTLTARFRYLQRTNKPRQELKAAE